MSWRPLLCGSWTVWGLKQKFILLPNPSIKQPVCVLVLTLQRIHKRIHFYSKPTGNTLSLSLSLIHTSCSTRTSLNRCSLLQSVFLPGMLLKITGDNRGDIMPDARIRLHNIITSRTVHLRNTGQLRPMESVHKSDNWWEITLHRQPKCQCSNHILNPATCYHSQQHSKINTPRLTLAEFISTLLKCLHRSTSQTVNLTLFGWYLNTNLI